MSHCLSNNENLSEEQMNTFHELFDSVDHRSSGELDVKQCIHLLRLLGIPIDNDEQFHRMINQDKNGKISFEQFGIFLAQKMKEGQNANIIVETFQYFDKDHDGFINVKDLEKIFLHLGEKLNEEELKEMLSSIDYDQDGFVSLQDFIQMSSVIVSCSLSN